MGRTHDPWEERVVYSVGHSNRTLDELLAVLAAAQVRTLVDVRRYPGSRRHPHFNRSEMSGVLLRHGIIYHHLGQALGGKTDVSYESCMLTPPFRRGIEMLEDLADATVTAILCAERDPADCHRRLISDALVDRGWRVVHLLGPDERRDHRPAEPQRRLF
jgi:uncharacterized protein (DUF488 family)